MKTINKYVYGLVAVLVLVCGVYSCNEDSINNLQETTAINFVKKEIILDLNLI